ncbi:MAG: STAS domain-containing protein [Phototrophicaceae bacterium]
MEVTSKIVDGIPILILEGRFDSYEVQRVSESVLQMMSEMKYLVVNLQATTFIDSSALSCLVQAMKRARLQQGDVILAAMSETVATIFELTRLNIAFTIYSTEAEAIQALQNGVMNK